MDLDTDILQDLAGTLQERLGEMAKDYEGRMALVSAQARKEIRLRDEEIARLNGLLESAKNSAPEED